MVRDFHKGVMLFSERAFCGCLVCPPPVPGVLRGVQPQEGLSGSQLSPLHRSHGSWGQRAPISDHRSKPWSGGSDFPNRIPIALPDVTSQHAPLSHASPSLTPGGPSAQA